MHLSPCSLKLWLSTSTRDRTGNASASVHAKYALPAPSSKKLVLCVSCTVAMSSLFVHTTRPSQRLVLGLFD